MKRHKTVDDFIQAHPEWAEMLTTLRRLILATEMAETVKWGFPVYTIDGKNVVGLGAFKSYAGLWFFNGAFMADPAGKMVNAQEGKTKGMRQWRFSTADEIDTVLVNSYLQEAIENQKAGKAIKPEKNKPLLIPAELEKALAENADLNESFSAMNLSYRREYAEYISEAKREATREKRLEKIIPMILRNEGMNDKYRK